MKIIIFTLLLSFLPVLSHAFGPHEGFPQKCVPECNKLRSEKMREAGIAAELHKLMKGFKSEDCKSAVKQLVDSNADRSFVTKTWRKITGRPGCHVMCLNSLADYCLKNKLITEADLPK